MKMLGCCSPEKAQGRLAWLSPSKAASMKVVFMTIP